MARHFKESPSTASSASNGGYHYSSGSYTQPSMQDYNPYMDINSYTKPPKRGKKIAIVLAILVALIVVEGILMLFSARNVKASAQELMGTKSTLTQAIKDGDTATLSNTLTTISDGTNAMVHEVETPWWQIACFVPVVGQDLRSVQTLAVQGDELVDNALVPVCNAVSGMKLSSLMSDGQINIDFIRTLSSAIDGAAPTLDSASKEISELPQAHISQLEQVMRKVRTPLGELNTGLPKIQNALHLLPQMLGADGQTRNYLMLAQNNAELRTTGGLPGSWGVLSLTDGKIEMGDDFKSAIRLANMGSVRNSATDEELAATDWTMATMPGQLNVTPDFSRVGLFANEEWEQLGLGSTDGTIAIDPVFLQSLLQLTGGFTAEDGTVVDGTNAAKLLMSDTYWRFGNNGDAQDEFFSSVAGQAFSHVMSNLGNASLTDLVNMIQSSIDDGRVLGYMANADEEALLDELGMSGKVSNDTTKPVFGLYMNDETWSKIDWYLHVSNEMAEPVQNADGTTTYHITTTLNNSLTDDLAAAAPDYIIGGNQKKRDRSDICTVFILFAPAGGQVSNLAFSDGAHVTSDIENLTLYGHQELRFHLNCRAQETVSFSYDVTVAADATEPLQIKQTPMAQQS